MSRVSVAISTACAPLNGEKNYTDLEETLCIYFKYPHSDINHTPMFLYNIQMEYK